MMRGRRPAGRCPQAGFSMVEMLMAAFILAIGLLGLASLQVMSLKASRGGQNLSMAVQMAEQVMDAVEQEGRQGWLNITDTDFATPAATSTHYISADGGSVYVSFALPLDSNGNALAPVASQPGSTKPADALYLATVTTSNTMAAATGKYSDFTVDLQFTDTKIGNGQSIVRHAILTRRILHG